MFIVMRTYTKKHNTRSVLWKVESRHFGRKEDAEFFRNFVEREYQREVPKGTHKFFVVETDFKELLG